MTGVEQLAFPAFEDTFAELVAHLVTAHPQGQPFVVLVTGSRTWADEQTIRDVLAVVASMVGPENLVIRHGHCPEGADAIADRIGTAWARVTVEHHSADWDTCVPDCRPGHRRTRRDGSTYCPGAGLRRDADMVAAGAHLCAAFIDSCAKPKCRRAKPHGSHGASHTADLADKAGIPTRRFP